MKKRSLLALLSLSFLLGGCSFDDVKDFISGIFHKEEKKEEEKPVDSVGLREANQNTQNATNYSMYINLADTTEATFKRDGNKYLYEGVKGLSTTEYGEQVGDNIYVYTYHEGTWEYSKTKTIEEGYNPLGINLNVEEIFSNPETAAQVEISQKDNVYTISAKDKEDDIKSYLEAYPDDAEKIRAAYAALGEKTAINITVEGKYVTLYDVTGVIMSRSLMEGSETEYEYKASTFKIIESYSNYDKTVVNRPSGIEVPPQL